MLTSIASSLPNVLGGKVQEEVITFADLAAYLVVTEESLQDVSSRLQDGSEMDITKFRPNIVLSGSKQAYEEDYWGGISITNKTSHTTENATSTEIVLTQNCGRCVRHFLVLISCFISCLESEDLSSEWLPRLSTRSQPQDQSCCPRMGEAMLITKCARSALTSITPLAKLGRAKPAAYSKS